MKIVTGMHRSGTSMISNLLYELGGDFGPDENLLPGDIWNQQGYFEAREIFGFNDQLLLGDNALSRRYWSTLPEERSLMLIRSQYVLVLPYTKVVSARMRAKQDRLRQLETTYGSLIVKDPRFSLLIGEWATYMPVEKILYCYRHPYEVAHSLRQRNGSPLLLGYFLWAFHVQHFLQASEGLAVVAVNYNHFFQADKRLDEIHRLFNYLEKPFDDAEAGRALSHILNDKLRNHTYSGGRLPHKVADLYATLNRYHHLHDQLHIARSLEAYRRAA